MSTLWLPTREPDALTRPRMVLASRLVDLRERAGFTVETAGEAIGSPALLRAMERGMTASSPHDVMALAGLYGVTDHATRVALVRLAVGSRQEGWWEPYRNLIRSWFLPYLGAEQAAEVIRCYAIETVPDLLQHPGYARHALRAAHPLATEAEIRRRMDLLLRRQRVLYASRPPQLWAIIDETALRHPPGTMEIMYRQLEHLLDLCELPHVTIQIMPLAASAILPPRPIVLVQVMPSRDIHQVVYLQQINTALYPDDVEAHRHAMNLLAVTAPPPQRTPDILLEMISYLRPQGVRMLQLAQKPTEEPGRLSAVGITPPR